MFVPLLENPQSYMHWLPDVNPFASLIHTNNMADCFVLHTSCKEGRRWKGLQHYDKQTNLKTYVIINLLKPTGHVMQQQFNIQQLYALSTLYLCVLYLSENKQRLVPLTA